MESVTEMYTMLRKYADKFPRQRKTYVIQWLESVMVHFKKTDWGDEVMKCVLKARLKSKEGLESWG